MPGPSLRRGQGCLADYEADRLGFLMASREAYGDFVRFDHNTTLVNSVSAAHEVLRRHDKFAVLTNFRNQRLTPDQAVATQSLRRHLNPPLRPGELETLRDATSFATRAAFLPVADLGAFDPVPRFEAAFAAAIANFYFGMTAERSPISSTGYSRH